MPGSRCATGTPEARCGTTPRTSAAHLRVRSPDLVLVGEHQRVAVELDALHGLAPLAGDRVGCKQLDVVDVLGSGQVLQHREDLAGLHGSTERPPFALGSAGDRVEVPVEGDDRLLLEVVGRGPGTSDELRDDGHALVEGRFDGDAGANRTTRLDVL